MDGAFCCKLVVELDIDAGKLVIVLASTLRPLEPRAGGGSGLPLLGKFLTCTQSGSGLGVKGLLGFLGFGKWSLDGGCTRALAGRPSKDEH